MFAHQASGARYCTVRRIEQGLDDVLLLLPGTVLAQLEFGFEPGDRDFEPNNVAEHALSIALTQSCPLLAIRGFECGNEIMEHREQFVGCGVGARLAVGVDCTIVPRGDHFSRFVVRR